MYSQLLKETILNIEFDKEAKAKFVNFCRVNYADNKTRLQKIDMFEREYEPHAAIWWYTKEPFIYSTLNKALRTQDITIIIMMAFFLKDLHREIEKLHQKSKETSEIIVYRGQGMLNADFEKMKNSEGALLSFNNFLSTSANRAVANLFASSSPDDPNLTGVLFKMKIDPLVSTSPFGLLGNSSHHSDNEEEILFSMHTIFRITELQRMDHDRLWEVTLTSTSDNDKQLLQLTNHIQNELGTDSGWVRLGHLMYQMGAFEKAEQIYKTVIETACGNDDTELLKTLIPICNNIGVTHRSMGEYEMALSYFEKALEIQQKSLPHNHPDLATISNNIGMTHQLMGDYPTALSYFEKTLEIQQNSLPDNHPDLATTNNNLGAINHLIGNYPAALSYFEKTLEIRQKSLPPDHPALATANNNIGTTHQSMEDYPTALLYFEKTLEIQQKSLSSDHPALATTKNNIGTIFEFMEEHSTALSYFEEALEIQRKSLPRNHPEKGTTYNNIGSVYASRKDWLTALAFYEDALKIYQNSIQSNPADLAYTYSTIGNIHYQRGDPWTALPNLEKAQEIADKYCLPNSPDLFEIYSNKTSILNALDRREEAINCGEKCLQVALSVFGLNHWKTKYIESLLEELQQILW
jgi:tetratricopeptide (TPR) repeat protein